MGRDNENSTFWVRCIGYKQNFEKFFTIGAEYEVCDGVIVSDKGYQYSQDVNMKPNSDPQTWYLAAWYEFEIINDVIIPIHLDICIDDMLG